MQLNEILEENSVKSIAKRTNISEENLEALFSGEFDFLKKVKTLGFISIIEREYGADLSSLCKQAVEYYDSHPEDESIVLDAPVIERKKGKSKLLVFSVLILLGIASWYFIMQFDQEKLRGLLPFNEEKMISGMIRTEADSHSELSIERAITDKKEEPQSGAGSIVIEAVSGMTENSGTEKNQSN